MIRVHRLWLSFQTLVEGSCRVPVLTLAIVSLTPRLTILSILPAPGRRLLSNT